MVLKVNGTQIKNPTSQQVQRYNLTKSGRVASGDMTMELVAKKVKIQVKYDVISGAEIKKIRDIIDGNDMFFDVTYEDEVGTLNTVTCYVGALDMERFRAAGAGGGGWYWKNFAFDFIQK